VRGQARLQRGRGLAGAQEHGAQAEPHGRELALGLHVAHRVLGRHGRAQARLRTPGRPGSTLSQEWCGAPL